MVYTGKAESAFLPRNCMNVAICSLPVREISEDKDEI